MAQYGLKYYAEFRNTRNQDYRLEITQRIDNPDIRPTARRIGYLSGCSLELQGNLSSVISPIVKTQLRFTLVDAADITDTSSVKYGNWQELFTPDSTLYKVRVARIIDGQNNWFWTGYITPDSWLEDLDYRGQITITARDNLGHLQDFLFDATGDANGLISIMDLVDAAMAKIDFPMTYGLQTGDGIVFPEGTAGGVHDALVNVSLFEDMDWYQVLEQSLEAIGYVFRYIDGNQFMLTPLRNSMRPCIAAYELLAQLTYSNYYESNANYTLRITGDETYAEGDAWATGSSTEYSMLNELFADAGVDNDLTIEGGADANLIYTDDPDYEGATFEIFKTSEPSVVIASGTFSQVQSSPVSMEFYGGTLEMDPAVKEIAEEQDYGSNESAELSIKGGITYATPTTYYCMVQSSVGPIVSRENAPVSQVSNAGKTCWNTAGFLLNPNNYWPDDSIKNAEGDSWNQYAFLPANQADSQVGGVYVPSFSYPSILNLYTRTLGIRLSFTFAPSGLTITGTGDGRLSNLRYNLKKVYYSLFYMNGNNARYFDGSDWSDTYARLSKTFDGEYSDEKVLEVTLVDDNNFSGGYLFFYIENIEFEGATQYLGKGAYARLARLEVKLEGTVLLSGNKVRTINNNIYNIKITRSPLFGALSRDVGFITAENYKKAMFYYPSGTTKPQQFPYMVHFTGQSATDDVPLPVAIHQQIMCFYFGAARVLNGNCAPVDKDMFYFNRLCTYKGHDYLLQGGTLDLFTGILGGAFLREFIEFSDLWSGTPTYSEEVIYNN